MSRLFQITLLSLLIGLVACGYVDPPESDPMPSVSALASAQPLDHGLLAFAAPITLELARKSPQHAFHFVLSDQASVTLRTLADGVAAPVDTVLALYREGASRPLATNDDDGRSRFSRITRTLPAGGYRVLVLGEKRSSEGRFQLVAGCTGAGCPPAEPAQPCLFGDTFYALHSEGLLAVLDEHWIRTASELASELEGQQLLIAVQQSSHTDVMTVAEALAAVDQNEVRRMRLRDTPSGREYDVFEYGAGDNSYGAIFRADSLLKAATIHDGDLMACTEW
jgi:hypothetical protein